MSIKVSALYGSSVVCRSLFAQRRERLRVRGIVEPLEKRMLLSADFGDAPLPYPVTLAEFGAQHIVGGLRLGDASVDIENDGTHSGMADFDDLNGSTSDDEDGVTFGTIQVGALDAMVMVNVQGAPGKLDAWIDFNRDGSWGGPGEKIFARQDVTVGENVLRFDVPSFAVAGTTFARFRLSTAGGLGPRGQASDGEVEDYQLTIKGPPTAASGVFVGQNVIKPTPGKYTNVLAVDMDADGDMDVLSASPVSAPISPITWYENDGSQNFTPRPLTTSPVEIVFAADMDGDGDMDILSASDRRPSMVAWHENDGSQNFTEHRIAEIPAWSVFGADVDGDGDMDVLSAGPAIAWHENDGSQNFTTRTISTAAGSPRLVFGTDVDGDGDMDVLSGGQSPAIAWYENDGNQNFTTRTISSSQQRAYRLFTADVDGDGDMDVLSGGRSPDIAWYENDGSQNFTEHTITTEGSGGVPATDMDGDGDMDVLHASGWFENDGSQNFTTHTISTTGGIVSAADVDGDGDLDLLSASIQEGFAWHEQRILGDSNNDSVFDSSDLVAVLQAGKYEDGIDDNATFDEGDWNQDGVFDSSDLVLAFQNGHYVAAARPLEAEIAAATDWLFAQDDDSRKTRAFVA